MTLSACSIGRAAGSESSSLEVHCRGGARHRPSGSAVVARSGARRRSSRRGLVPPLQGGPRLRNSLRADVWRHRYEGRSLLGLPAARRIEASHQSGFLPDRAIVTTLAIALAPVVKR
jgi:hypothetical protein